MTGFKVTEFRPVPLEEGQKIRILEGPRRGDWLVIGVDERKMRLKCPVSGREVELDRFAVLSATLENEEWPLKDFAGTVARRLAGGANPEAPADATVANEGHRNKG